ncbi:hypothetical protein HJFPF1_11733 [Paramyrothecium foliicola]|nr:hypothetical protein HJFPF1_11733 [Paramyrothecium foliicola]
MPAPPSTPDLPRRPLHERSSSQNNRPGIRIVPYSPPRLSSDGSTNSRVVSRNEADGSSMRSSQARQSSVESTPGPDCQAAPELHVSALRRSTGPVPPNLSPVKEPPANPRAPSSPSSPMRRQKKVISINSDKTFSLVAQSRSASSRSDSVRSPLSSLTTPRSSYGRSSDNWTEERPSSPLTPLAEHSPSPEPSPSPASKQDPASNSPWNYRLVGGLRKVRNTPESKEKQSVPPSKTRSRSSSESSLHVLPVLVPSEQGPIPSLSNKDSFQSSQSDSTTSETANYKVHQQSSPVVRSGSVAPDPAIDLDELPPSSSHSNYQVHHASSFDSLSLNEPRRPQTGDSDANYVVHDGSSLSLAPSRTRLRSEYSQESLIVPPLRPTRRRSFEISSLTKSRSRDSLRTGSLTSLSTIISQEATRALFAGAASIQIPPRLYRQNSRGALAVNNPHTAQMITAHPHQWSSQLSTVASESEGGSEPPSRSVSSLSAPGRRGSGVSSGHGRRVLSISSTLSGLEENSPQPSPRLSHSRSGSLEHPPATYQRQPARDSHATPLRLVRDHDEDGDGLADLEALHHRLSRTRLNGTLSSRSSDWNLRSSASSRTNSLTSQTFPTWARLYYGSGERRLLTVPSSDSMFSQFHDSRPASTFLHKAPSLERLAGNLYSPRRRPREQQPQSYEPGESSRRSMDITPNPIISIARGLKKQTSSIWSPHLHRDKRANAYSMWEPPAADWSNEKGSPKRRNIQFVLFVAGFVVPLAWMIGALLPLPSDPQNKLYDQEAQSTSHIDFETNLSTSAQGLSEARYRHIQWWRSVNRGMSIVGVLVIAAIIALSVVGVRQQW